MSCSHFAWKRTGWAKLSDPRIEIWVCEGCGEEGWQHFDGIERSGVRLSGGELIVPKGFPCEEREGRGGG